MEHELDTPILIAEFQTAKSKESVTAVSGAFVLFCSVLWEWGKRLCLLGRNASGEHVWGSVLTL